MELRTLTRNERDVVGKIFRDKEELAMRYTIDMEYKSESGSSFEKTLMRLKYEMVQLMRCDVQLYKQLTELSNSIHDLKEDFKQFENFRPRLSSFTTNSSTDESYVSAAEHLEDSSPRFNGKQTLSGTSDSRILSWINNCEQFPKGNEDYGSDDDNWFGNHRQRSFGYNGHLTKKVSNDSRDKLLSKQCKATWRDYDITVIKDLHNSNRNVIPPRLNNFRTPSVHVTTKSRNMKTLQDTEIRAEEILTSSYKRSLRLLGSVRMQSRIFEPLHSKYRHSTLLRTIESFISVPKSFLNIQPRPKLHRQSNVLELYETDISDVYSPPLTTWTSKSKCQDSTHYCTSSVTPVTKEGDAEEDRHSDTVSSDDNATLDSNNAKKCEDSIVRADSGFNEESEELTDSELDAESDTEIESFQPKFLYTNDGLVTCRIMSPGLENELAKRQPESEDFEFLVLVDGRVSFIPHDKESTSDESYYLAWIFEDMGEETCSDDNMSEYYFIDKLFETTDQVAGDINDGSSGDMKNVNGSSNSFADGERNSNCDIGSSVYTTACVDTGYEESPASGQYASDTGGLYECHPVSNDNGTQFTEYKHDLSRGMNSVKNLDKFDQEWSMDSGLGDEFTE